MTRLKRWLLVDCGSVSMIVAYLVWADSPWWAYVLVLVYGMAQKYHGQQCMKEEIEGRE